MAAMNNQNNNTNNVENDHEESNNGYQKNTGFTRKISKHLRSMTTGIILLIVIALLSIPGTLIPQQEHTEHYYSQYGENLGEFILTVGLDNVFETWWFIALMILLCANLFFCSLSRLPGIYSRAFRPVKLVSKENLNKYESSAVLEYNLPEEQAVEKLADQLQNQKYKVEILQDSENDEAAVFAERGKLGYFGSFLTHFSIVVLIVGFAYGNMMGFEDFIFGEPGDIMEVEQADFDLRVDDFEIEYRDDQSIEQYYSTLTVIENGQEIQQEQIYVNQPLRYEGINFYQSSYGWSGDLHVENLETGVTETVKMYEDTTYNILGPLTVYMHSFFPDYVLGDQGPTNKSPQPNNPRFIWMLYEGDQVEEMFVTEPGETVEYNGLELQFTDFDQYTGLQVVRDPGVPIFIFGSILMIAGLIMSFYLYPKRLWARISKTNSGWTKMIIAGKGLKDTQGFKREFSELVSNELNKQEESSSQ